MSEKDFIETIQAQQDIMVKQLTQLCEINSGTGHLDGLERMATALETLFSPLVDQVQSMRGQYYQNLNMRGFEERVDCGRHLYFRKRPELKRRVLLMGHMDTVYAADHPFQTLQYLNENTLNGPGVADMKGGLLVLFHALHHFEQCPEAERLGWDVLINSDEEVGSYTSAKIIDDVSPKYQAALIYEPATTPEGALARNRRGSGKITLTATGKSAHVGRAFEQGRNAICHLALIISAIHGLNGQRSGVTVNIGKIAGGEALNMVAEKAVVKLDVRINDPKDETWVRQQLDNLINQHQHPDYTLTMHANFARPVKTVDNATKKLFQKTQVIAHRLGLTLNWQDSGGCCDGNNIAQHGVPVLDTLGVRGGKIHSSEEYILLDSLSERCALSALLLRELAQGGLEGLTL